LVVGAASKGEAAVAKIGSAGVSAGRIVSDPMLPAVTNASEKPSAGTTAVARVTRSFTETMKASACIWSEPQKISRLFGPPRGNPQDATKVTLINRATARAHRDPWIFTARSPRPGRLPRLFAVNYRMLVE